MTPTLLQLLAESLELWPSMAERRSRGPDNNGRWHFDLMERPSDCSNPRLKLLAFCVARVRGQVQSILLLTRRPALLSQLRPVQKCPLPISQQQSLDHDPDAGQGIRLDVRGAGVPADRHGRLLDPSTEHRRLRVGRWQRLVRIPRLPRQSLRSPGRLSAERQSGRRCPASSHRPGHRLQGRHDRDGVLQTR